MYTLDDLDISAWRGDHGEPYSPYMSLADIDPMSQVPVWRQLYDLLRDGIANGDYPAGSPLPSAARIVQETGLARGTVIKAVDKLKADGLIVMVPGKGPYVAKQP